MFIKLQYTQDKNLIDVFRVIHNIIKTPSITSASSLDGLANAQGWAITTRSDFDASNSIVVRTNDVSTLNSHFNVYYNNGYSYTQFRWTLEFSVPDAPSRKVYSQYISNDGSNFYHNIGDSVSAPISSTSAGATQRSANIGYGTGIGVIGNAINYLNENSQFAYTSVGAAKVRCLWAYITDKSFVWCATLDQATNSGFGTTYNTNGKFMGPFINSMYTRYDYWNKESNDIIPWYYTNTRGNSVGYGAAHDLNAVLNPSYTTSLNHVDSRVFNMIEASSKNSTYFPMIYHSGVNTRIGHRSNYYYPHINESLGTVGTASAISYGKTLSTTSFHRYPSADLSATTFMNHPIGWDHWGYNSHGGNVSEEAGVYIFNGDYVPGDTFSVGGKVYMIWPMYGFGYTSRIGLSVPME